MTQPFEPTKAVTMPLSSDKGVIAKVWCRNQTKNRRSVIQLFGMTPLAERTPVLNLAATVASWPTNTTPLTSIHPAPISCQNSHAAPCTATTNVVTFSVSPFPWRKVRHLPAQTLRFRPPPFLPAAQRTNDDDDDISPTSQY